MADEPGPIPGLVDGPTPFPSVVGPARIVAVPFEGDPPTKNVVTGREGEPLGSSYDPNPNHDGH
ncbi:MAG TPA: hypothetical protein VGD48_24075 [Kutzneria sp.]